MNRAAACLVGNHDFTSFCVGAAERDSRVCDVALCVWQSVDDHTLSLNMEADRFVRSMVRSIVGTLVDVGRGSMNEQRVPSILAARDRREAGPTAPPTGLFLKRVDYEV